MLSLEPMFVCSSSAMSALSQPTMEDLRQIVLSSESPSFSESPRFSEPPRFSDLKNLNKQTLCTLMKVMNLDVDPTQLKALLAAQLRQRMMLLLEQGGGGGGGGNDGADNRGEGGGGDGGDGGGDDESGEDGEESADDDSESEDGEDVMKVHVRMPSGRTTLEITVSIGETVSHLKSIILAIQGIPRHLQRILFEGAELQNSGLLAADGWYDCVLRISGGGKRAAGGAAKTAGKETEMRMLHDSMHMLLLRLQTNLNASPVIPKINEAVMKQNAVSEDVSCEFLEELLVGRGLNEKGLDKLLMITTVSTRKEERCKQITAILFAGEIAMLNELGALATSGKTVLELSVQLVISKIFMDPTGLLAWEIRG